MIITECDLSLQETACVNQAKQKDTAWCLLRSRNDTEDRANTQQLVPGWSGFNAVISTDIPSLSTVGYCPVIEASPTELSTVYTLLKRSVEMGQQLGQEEVIIVMDLAMYAKAQEIVWKKQEEFSHVILRLGAFHTAMMFLAILGKRFGDAGLSDIVIEAGIVAPGSIPAVLEGRQYNRAMRTHKIVMEAMQRLRIKAFYEWAQKYHGHLFQPAWAAMDDVSSEITSDNFNIMLLSPEFTSLLELFDEFCKLDRGKLAAFWDSYIDLVCLLLRFTRATREGNWVLHLASVREMLPWVFAYDRTNYARYLSVYWCEMTTLPQTHPESNALLLDGHFTVQRNSKSAFAQVAVDQTIEQTLNRDSKTSGGIVGISLNQGAVQRWVLTAHDRARTLQICRKMAGMYDAQNQHHKETSSSRLKRDEGDVKKVMDTIESWVNPYETKNTTDSLINIASGVKANDDITEDILSAEKKGAEAFTSFVQERLCSSQADLYAPLAKTALKTFRNLVKSKKTKAATTDVVIKADRGLFAKMVVIAQHRQMNMKEVLQYPLGPLPWSLATPDGAPAKTTKASLLHSLEEQAKPAEDVPTTAVWIFDGMALLQAIKTVPKTFKDLATYVLEVLKSTSNNHTRTDLVMDQYPELSIKNPERVKRGASGLLQMRILGRHQRCPAQWKKFLSDGGNKTNLATFLVEELQQPEYASKFKGFGPLYITHGDECHKLVESDGRVKCSRVDQLCTSKEEADTRILLHASHAASEGHACIIIKSPDTDVAVLACAYSHQINARLLFCTGTTQRQRYLDATAIGRKLGSDVCEALPGMHAFTGSDSTSAFVGKGKKQAFKLVVSDVDMCNAMRMVGSSFHIDDERLQACGRFVCSLYGYSGNDTDLVRYKLFCTKNAQTCHLPPTQDALKYHVKRANYQACIWRSALDAFATTPSPDGHGWDLKNDTLAIHWMDKPPAPKALLLLISCKCSTSQCKGSRCSCLMNGLPCTDACECKSCANTPNIDPTESSDDDDDD